MSTTICVYMLWAHMQVRQVATGGMHTVAVLDNGTVYSWGVNDEGALGRQTEGPLWTKAEVCALLKVEARTPTLYAVAVVRSRLEPWVYHWAWRFCVHGDVATESCTMICSPTVVGTAIRH